MCLSRVRSRSPHCGRDAPPSPAKQILCTLPQQTSSRSRECGGVWWQLCVSLQVLACVCARAQVRAGACKCAQVRASSRARVQVRASAFIFCVQVRLFLACKCGPGSPGEPCRGRPVRASIQYIYKYVYIYILYIYSERERKKERARERGRAPCPSLDSIRAAGKA